ncbi:hypothetical protein K431DRAFT_310672 [Polychaeton citri CBS 116435]|uniref:CYTH domain-containing protein n=1 Tax=Polychaeton citri CBS 116435 TaxID=1314669 RepID=A0A9P4USP7_9PEZI|nr:hypothetical protein K431DRAFT_310672 [Polychaeton citri CBS 116435]
MVSKIEVERKFLPTTILEAMLKGNTGLHSAFLGGSLTFNRQPNQVLRDTYFDLDGKLEVKGLWVRYRALKEVPSADYPSINTTTSDQWEAKVRVGGGYAKSEFVEVEGIEGVKEEIAKHIPGTKLTKLQATADLETYRSTWVVKEEGFGTVPPAGICIALDYIVEAGRPYAASGSEAFRHYVGEVEMMGSAETDGPDEHEAVKDKVTGEVAMILDAFLARHQELFLTYPEPTGKLGAFFTWKMGRL